MPHVRFDRIADISAGTSPPGGKLLASVFVIELARPHENFLLKRNSSESDIERIR